MQRIDLLYNFSEEFRFRFNLEDFLKKLACTSNRITTASYCTVALFDSVTDELYYFMSCNYDKSFNPKIKEDFSRTKSGEGIIGWAAAHKTTLNLKQPSKDIRYNKAIDEKLYRGDKSILAVPMISHNKLIGAIELFNKQNKPGFTKSDEKAVSILASHAALLIDIDRMAEENVKDERLSLLGQSIANSAHGLKNLLNNLDGGTFIVEKGFLSQNMGMVNKGWDILKRNSQRMREMVVDLLLFSRPAKPEHKKTDINNICTDVAKLLRENASQNRTEIVLNLQKDIGTIFLDPKGIYRCILNLTINAIQACPKKRRGKVEINTRLYGTDYVQIQIKDNGSGISEENLKHIFDVFFSTKGSKGTGLGLPVSQKIIKEHYGTIDVQSKSGIGTSFIITLPVIRSESMLEKFKI